MCPVRCGCKWSASAFVRFAFYKLGREEAAGEVCLDSSISSHCTMRVSLAWCLTVKYASDDVRRLSCVVRDQRRTRSHPASFPLWSFGRFCVFWSSSMLQACFRKALLTEMTAVFSNSTSSNWMLPTSISMDWLLSNLSSIIVGIGCTKNRPFTGSAKIGSIWVTIVAGSKPNWNHTSLQNKHYPPLCRVTHIMFCLMSSPLLAAHCQQVSLVPQHLPVLSSWYPACGCAKILCAVRVRGHLPSEYTFAFEWNNI